MINQHSKCIYNLKVGDEVLMKLLPYRTDYKTFHEPILFPIIGFNRYGAPLIGTMNRDFYSHHHFITTKMYDFASARPEVLQWTYCMGLDAADIQIEKVIKKARRIESAPV
jgi:hypothetical protein